MTIVSKASPLVKLAHIGKLESFHQLCGELIVPETVRQEVVGQRAGHTGADEVKTAPWIKVGALTNKPLVLQEAQRWKRRVWNRQSNGMPVSGFPGYQGDPDGGTVGPIACP
jgi:hypothetical protein